MSTEHSPVSSESIESDSFIKDENTDYSVCESPLEWTSQHSAKNRQTILFGCPECRVGSIAVLDHGDIIKYCDRPFESVEAMNETLVEHWNAVVDPGDEVLYGGDLTISYDTADLLDWLDRLNGELVFLLSNHDETVIETLDGVAFFAHYRFEAGDYRFYAVHDPADAAVSDDEWILHGHHHNNWTDEFPFVDPEAQRVNFSIELTEYRPLPIRELTTILDRNERFADRGAVT